MDKKYPIDEVFEILGKENLEGNYVNHANRKSMTVDGYEVYIRSLRYMTFYQKGLTCACCGKKGAYFKLDGEENSNRRHFNLYSEDGILMTKDHIIPKSLGGLDSVSNMQTMCVKCNVAKGNGIQQTYNLISVDKDGNEKKYTSIASAVLSLIYNRKSKNPERVVMEVITKTDMIRDSINNGTYFHNRRWYIAKDN